MGLAQNAPPPPPKTMDAFDRVRLLGLKGGVKQLHSETMSSCSELRSLLYLFNYQTLLLQAINLFSPSNQVVLNQSVRIKTINLHYLFNETARQLLLL